MKGELLWWIIAKQIQMFLFKPNINILQSV